MSKSNEFESLNNKVLETCNYHTDIARKFINQFKNFIEQIEDKEIISELETICNTKDLIIEINKIDLLDFNQLRKIAHRLDMLDEKYMFELKERILDKADIIEFNDLDKRYSSDEDIKNELLNEIVDIASNYGIEIVGIEEESESL